jgi:FkbM family methyltransferase
VSRLSRYARILGWRCVPKAILGKLLRAQLAHRMKPPGIAHSVLVRVPSTDLYAYDKIFHLREYGSDLIVDPKVIVDAGANVGFASVFFANAYPQARIFAIEPEPSNFRQLMLNTAPYDRVKCIQAALWHEDGEAGLFNPCEGNLGFMLDRVASGQANAPLVKTRLLSIPSLLKSEGMERIGLLKLDIEGSELGVLRNCPAWIAQVDAIVAELHEDLAPGCAVAWNAATEGFARRWQVGENEFAVRH